MNFDDTPEDAAFRREARAWIEANAPHHLREAIETSIGQGALAIKVADMLGTCKAWQQRKSEAGWSCLHWPVEYGGRDASTIERLIWHQEEGVFAELNKPFQIGQGMCGATLMKHGTQAQRIRYVPPIASGQEVWCQLFSEPAAGSDLGGIRTRADRAGDDWILNGQKIWTSFAHFADFGMLLTRTDPTVPKHDGLTMFCLDMKAPGVEVRPIRQADGRSHFNEVYFTDVRLSDVQRVGDVGSGWRVALTMLMNERVAIGSELSTTFPELLRFCLRFDSGSGPAIDDPMVRSRLAAWAVRDSGLRYGNYRSISAEAKGQNPGAENSISKLVAGQMRQEIAMFALDLQGQAGVAMTPEVAEDNARFQMLLLHSPGMRLAGGTDEILRNIIAERVLGLPSDVRADRGIPFNKIPTQVTRP